MGKNKKTHKQASRENYFALKSGYDQHPTLTYLTYNQIMRVNFFLIKQNNR